MRRCGLVAALSVLLSLPAADRVDARTLKFVSDLYCPFTCEVGARQEGYLVELVRMASAGTPFQIEYAVYPWERALVMIRQDQADGILAISARRSDGLLQSSVIGFDTVAVTSLSVWVPPAPDSDLTWLDRFKLGVVTFPLEPENHYERYLALRRQQNPSGIVTVAGENASALLVRMLVAGRVTAAVENPQVMRHLLHKGFPDVAFWQRAISEPRPLYIGVRDTPDNRVWLAQFEQALAVMREDGRLARLLATYGLADWVTSGAEAPDPPVADALPTQ